MFIDGEKERRKKMKDKVIKDTANEVGAVGECLYSIGNRVEIAMMLDASFRETDNPTFRKWLETELEDIAYFVQAMVDEHCVVKEE